MLHFQSPIYPELAVKSFMTYLHRLGIQTIVLILTNLAVLGACSATSAAAVGVISRTTCPQHGESSGHLRLSIKTADLERLLFRINVIVPILNQVLSISAFQDP